MALRIVPRWWADFCGAYDVAAALYLAWLLWKRANQAERSSPTSRLASGTAAQATP